MNKPPNGKNISEKELLEWEEFCRAIEDCDATDEEKRALYGVIRDIIQLTLDIAFGIDSTRLAIAARDVARRESSNPDTRLDSVLRKPFEAANDPALLKEIKKKGN